MLKKIKNSLRRSYFVSCAYFLLTDLFFSLKYKLGIISTDSGNAHASISLDESLGYIEEVLHDYKKYSGKKNLLGKIAEVGPGDNCGVGILLLGEGSDHVDLVDRFYSNRNEVDQAKIYKKILDKYPQTSKVLDNSNLEDERTFKMLKRWYGPQASAEIFFKDHKSYDYIISRAVFEHLYDPLLALKLMASALTSHGMLLHKVDLRDHGMFSNNFHELKFLEIPRGVYDRMTKSSGRPNRVLVNEYRKTLECLDLDFQILVTRLAGVGDITPHKSFEEIEINLTAKSIDYIRSVRKQFAKEFDSVSDEDLCVAGIFIVANKAS